MRIIPPVIAAFYLIAAWGLDRLFPGLHIIGAPFDRFGLFLIGASTVLGAWALILFKRRRTTIHTYDTPTKLVTDGPFSLSRSPMYLSMTVLLLGVAMYVGTLPWFLVPVAFALTMNASYIPREEATLERLFGREYLEYRSRVRRWL